MSAGRPVGDQPDVPLDAVAHGTEIGHIQSLHTARRHRVTVATSPEARPRSATTVTLPRHLWWSGLRRFDLADPVDRRRVYELVLREGTAADVRAHVTRDGLRDCLDDLVLPAHLRRLWQEVLGAG